MVIKMMEKYNDKREKKKEKTYTPRQEGKLMLPRRDQDIEDFIRDLCSYQIYLSVSVSPFTLYTEVFVDIGSRVVAR
jgi:hypothetical protein